VGQSGVAVMSLVLDASVTLAWIYQDETTEGVQRSFDLVRTNGAWVRFYGFGRLQTYCK